VLGIMWRRQFASDALAALSNADIGAESSRLP
jgi:hypothetical protein